MYFNLLAWIEACDEEFLSKHGTTFLAETWIKAGKYKECITGKTAFVQHARSSGGRGRPSGRLEAYVTSALDPKIVVQSDMVLAVLVRDVLIVGCYFKPTLEIDEITEELALALQKASNQEKVVLLGDFNLKPGSAKFVELEHFLEQYNVTLRSDPKTHTYFHATGASTLDHVFVAGGLEVEETLVHDLLVSDHKPISLVIRITCKNSCQSTRLHQKRTNLDKAAELLRGTPVSDITPGVLSSLLSPDDVKVGQRPSRKNKPWFTPFLKDLRDRTMAFLWDIKGGSPNYHAYSIARTAYHKNLRQSEIETKIMEVQDYLDKSKNGDMNLLFKRARNGAAAGSSVSISVFLNHCKTLFQRVGIPTFPVLPLAEPDRHPLLNKITEDEVEYSLGKQDSKAPGLHGYSPWQVKQLSILLVKPLAQIYSKTLEQATVPSIWLNSVLFFLFKKGERMDPNNYRSIAIHVPS